MKKILLFLSAILLINCTDEVEVIYKEYDNLPTSNGDPHSEDPQNQNIKLVVNGNVLYNPSLGYLNLTNTHIEVEGGTEPTHIAIRLFENQQELNPMGYWHFEVYQGNPLIWVRPVQIELLPDEIQGNSIGIQIFAKYPNVTGFQLVGWADNVPIHHP